MAKKKTKKRKNPPTSRRTSELRRAGLKTKKPKAVKRAKVKKGAACTAYLGLGSNLGDREEYIQQAIYLLEKVPGIEVGKISSIYETEPEGKSDQPLFLNAALEIKTSLDPGKLIGEVRAIENVLGRERDVQWGPRTIDIDILLYENEIISSDNVQIPHPLMHERAFVLKPLFEIAPRVVHPVFSLTVEEMYDELTRELEDKHDVELKGEFKRLTNSRDFQGMLKESTFE